MEWQKNKQFHHLKRTKDNQQAAHVHAKGVAKNFSPQTRCALAVAAGIETKNHLQYIIINPQFKINKIQ